VVLVSLTVACNPAPLDDRGRIEQVLRANGELDPHRGLVHLLTRAISGSTASATSASSCVAG